MKHRSRLHWEGEQQRLPLLVHALATFAVLWASGDWKDIHSTGFGQAIVWVSPSVGHASALYSHWLNGVVIVFKPSTAVTVYII